MLLFVTAGLSASEPTLTPPVQDYVLRFGGNPAGDGQFALAPDSPLLVPDGDFTMMGWFYWEQSIPRQSILMGQLSNPWLSPPNYSRLLRTNHDGNLGFVVHDGTNPYEVTGPIPAFEEWVHVAGVLRNGIMRLFIDGEEVGSTAFSGTPYPQVTRFALGAASTEDPAPIDPFSGFAQQVSVWDRGLDAAEISAAAANGLSGSESGLIAYWQLDDEPESMAAADASVNALDLRLNQRYFSPDWAESRPWQYPLEAVANPYFKVHVQQLLDPPYVRESVAADVYVLDLDGDGLDDLVVGEVNIEEFQERPLLAFRNNGDFTFTEITDAKLGVVNTVLNRFGEVADFNGDGMDDLLIVDTGPDTEPFPGRQNTLMLGNHGGRMQDVSRSHLPLINDLSHALAVGDIDGDGDTDALAGQQGNPNDIPLEDKIPEVFVNDGSGRFTLENNRLPTSQQLVSNVAVVLIDVDQDGDKDALMSAEYPGGSLYFGRSTLVLLKNDGAGRFSFEGPGDMFENEFYSEENRFVIDLVATDLDNDGYEDVLASYTIGYNGGGIWFFRNNGDGSFSKIDGAFTSSFFGQESTGYWLDFLYPADFNNDGWIDIFARSTTMGDYLFINNADLTFRNESSVLTPKMNAFDSVAEVIDLDNDGRLDIVDLSNGQLVMLENVRDLNSETLNSKIDVGHAGAWFNPDTAGQGQLIDIEPASQFMFLAWFAYTEAGSANPNEQHWLTAQGPYSGDSAVLPIYETLGGKFNDPQAVSSTAIGLLELSFTDCVSGQADYTIDTWGVTGSFPLARVIPGSENVCLGLANSTLSGLVENDGRDGAWYDPETAGQGFLIDVHPNPDAEDFIFVAWFTFGDTNASGQRWLTAQGPLNGTRADIAIYETTGGSFDAPTSVSSEQIGTMTIEFNSCNSANLSYELTNESISGSIDILRVVPGTEVICEELANVN